jgi:hypothetical protein
VCQGEESQVAAERIVVGDRGEHRADVLADASLRVSEAWCAPVESRLQTRVGEEVPLEGVVWGDRDAHAHSMAAAGGQGHWDIPMQ